MLSRNQPHQRFELAAFSFPTNPPALRAAPHPRPMNHQKPRCLSFKRWVVGVQLFDAGYHIVKQPCVGGHTGLCCISPVGQQRKLCVVFHVGQPMQAQPLAECAVAAHRSQHARDDHQHAVLRLYALRKIQPGQ